MAALIRQASNWNQMARCKGWWKWRSRIKEKEGWKTIHYSHPTENRPVRSRQTAYFELKRISSIRRFLTEDAAKTLVTSNILSRDYCNYLLMGTPNYVIQPLQKIQNFAARLTRRLLAPRHWPTLNTSPGKTALASHFRTRYKVACMCFNATNGSGPAYLSKLLHVYTPSRTLRSSSDTRMLKIQQYKRRLMAFAPPLALDPTFGIHYKIGTAQTGHLLKPNWKPSSYHSIFAPANISAQFLLQ